MKFLLLLPVFATLLVVGYIGQSSQINESDLPPPPPPPTAETPAQPSPTEETLPTQATVEMNENGFLPSTAKIAVGGTVTFHNEGSGDRWPASAVHPTHTLYPEGGGCIGSAFDACSPVASGDEWSFIFNEAGTWNYHDHLNPSLTGTIVVE